MYCKRKTGLGFHIREQSDEVFYCIEGEFDIEMDKGMIQLCGGGIIISKGM